MGNWLLDHPLFVRIRLETELGILIERRVKNSKINSEICIWHNLNKFQDIIQEFSGQTG